MSHLQRKIMTKLFATGPTFRALFTNDTESDIPVISYTPDIGSVCVSNFCLNSTFQTANLAPAVVVTPADVLAVSGLARGPLWEGCPACAHKYDVGAMDGLASFIYLCTRIQSPIVAGVRGGVTIGFRSTQIQIRNSANAVISSGFSGAISATDTFEVFDDGTDTIGAIEVYRDGIFLCSNDTGAATGAANPYFGIAFASSGQILDRLELYETE